MKNLGQLLVSERPFSEILLGNWALVRAFIESDVRVVTSYPGSPTPEIADAIKSIPIEQNPFYFEFSVNEKVATEVAFGASVNGHLSCVFFKSVGLNVAADTFVQLGHMELIGGMVIILGDDPGANSSQNEQDNRHLAQLSYIPVFEPANPAEAYLMFKEAAALSQKEKMPVILRMTTHVCHAKQRVQFGEWQQKKHDNSSRFDKANGPYIPITSKVFPMKRRALEKLEKVREYAEKSKFNDLIDNSNEDYGIITWGLTHLSLLDVLTDITRKPDILKLGMSYPLPRQLIVRFLSTHKRVKVLEELDDTMEMQIKSYAYEERLSTEIIGKTGIDDWMGEYTPDKVSQVMNNAWPEIFPEVKLHSSDISPIPRPAQLCPGCGHRTAFYAIKQALGENDIAVADIGCHTLGFLPPYEVGEVLLCMGHSNGTASGLSLFNEERKVISLLGDSTLFHAGLPGIINAIFNKHKHTLIIMENGTTAMTGHQELPSTGHNFSGDTEKIPILQMLNGLGITNVRSVDTYNVKMLTEAIKAAMYEDEFNVVIAKHPCMLKFTRDLRRKGQITQPPVKVTEKCSQLHICVSEFGCPTYQINEDGTIWVQEDLCIGDGSCKQTCPNEAIESQKQVKE